MIYTFNSFFSNQGTPRLIEAPDNFNISDKFYEFITILKDYIKKYHYGYNWSDALIINKDEFIKTLNKLLKIKIVNDELSINIQSVFLSWILTIPEVNPVESVQFNIGHYNYLNVVRT